MTLFEFVIAKKAFHLEIFGKIILEKNDPFLGRRKYGITVSTQPGYSIFPVIGLFYGTNEQEKWINHIGFIEEDTQLEYDPDDVYTEITLRVEDFDYRLRSGRVWTTRADNGKVLDKPVACWILVPELRDKTPLEHLNYICFTDRNGSPQDTGKVIKHILTSARQIAELREKMNQIEQNKLGG